MTRDTLDKPWWIHVVIVVVAIVAGVGLDLTVDLPLAKPVSNVLRFSILVLLPLLLISARAFLPVALGSAVLLGLISYADNLPKDDAGNFLLVLEFVVLIPGILALLHGWEYGERALHGGALGWIVTAGLLSPLLDAAGYYIPLGSASWALASLWLATSLLTVRPKVGARSVARLRNAVARRARAAGRPQLHVEIILAAALGGAGVATIFATGLGDQTSTLDILLLVPLALPLTLLPNRAFVLGLNTIIVMFFADRFLATALSGRPLGVFVLIAPLLSVPIGIGRTMGWRRGALALPGMLLGGVLIVFLSSDLVDPPTPAHAFVIFVLIYLGPWIFVSLMALRNLPDTDGAHAPSDPLMAPATQLRPSGITITTRALQSTSVALFVLALLSPVLGLKLRTNSKIQAGPALDVRPPMRTFRHESAVYAITSSPVQRAHYELLISQTFDDLTFDELHHYCDALSELESLPPCYAGNDLSPSSRELESCRGYRLPRATELEAAGAPAASVVDSDIGFGFVKSDEILHVVRRIEDPPN